MKRFFMLLVMLAMAQGALGEEDKSLAQKAGHGITKGGEVAGHAIEKGGKAVGRGVRKGVEVTVEAVKKAEVWVGEKMQKGGEKLKKADE